MIQRRDSLVVGQPVLVGFDQQRADQANTGAAVREDADHARATPDLEIQPLDGIGRGDPRPMRSGIVQVAQDIIQAGFEDLHRLGKPGPETLDQFGRFGLGTGLIALYGQPIQEAVLAG